jgi:hypothetical protein
MLQFKLDQISALGWRAIAIMLLCALSISACTVRYDYEWEPYSIAAERVTTNETLAKGGSVSIINVQSNRRG